MMTSSLTWNMYGLLSHKTLMNASWLQSGQYVYAQHLPGYLPGISFLDAKAPSIEPTTLLSNPDVGSNQLTKYATAMSGMQSSCGLACRTAAYEI